LVIDALFLLHLLFRRTSLVIHNAMNDMNESDDMDLMRPVLFSMSHISMSQRVRKVLVAKKVILREFLVRFCLFERQHAGANNAGANSFEVLPSCRQIHFKKMSMIKIYFGLTFTG
jgi:hypothetical protein